MIARSDKEGVPDFLIPEGINEKALRILGCDCGLGCDFGDVRIVCVGGRNKGKMKAYKEFVKLLCDDKRKDVIIVRAPDPLPELKGNKMRPIVDGDKKGVSKEIWEIWERIRHSLQNKRTFK